MSETADKIDEAVRRVAARKRAEARIADAMRKLDLREAQEKKAQNSAKPRP